MLLSCWSRRMLSNVPHRPPLMFRQLAHRAWHPLGTEDRAAPKPKLANLTWHERGDTNLGECLRKDREIGKERQCIYIHRQKESPKNVDAAYVMEGLSIAILSVLVIHNTRRAFKLMMAKTESTLSREPLRLTCVGTYFWRQTENLLRLAVMCFSLSVSFFATLMGFNFPKSQASRNFISWQKEFMKWSW